MDNLTPRELQLANLVAAGFSNQQISVILAICRQTVKNHIRAIYKKLHVNNRVELSVRLAGNSVEDVQLHFVHTGVSHVSAAPVDLRGRGKGDC